MTSDDVDDFWNILWGGPKNDAAEEDVQSKRQYSLNISPAVSTADSLSICEGPRARVEPCVNDGRADIKFATEACSYCSAQRDADSFTAEGCWLCQGCGNANRTEETKWERPDNFFDPSLSSVTADQGIGLKADYSALSEHAKRNRRMRQMQARCEVTALIEKIGLGINTNSILQMMMAYCRKKRRLRLQGVDYRYLMGACVFLTLVDTGMPCCLTVVAKHLCVSARRLPRWVARVCGTLKRSLERDIDIETSMIFGLEILRRKTLGVTSEMLEDDLVLDSSTENLTQTRLNDSCCDWLLKSGSVGIAADFPLSLLDDERALSGSELVLCERATRDEDDAMLAVLFGKEESRPQIVIKQVNRPRITEVDFSLLNSTCHSLTQLTKLAELELQMAEETTRRQDAGTGYRVAALICVAVAYHTMKMTDSWVCKNLACHQGPVIQRQRQLLSLFVKYAHHLGLISSSAFGTISRRVKKLNPELRWILEELSLECAD